MNPLQKLNEAGQSPWLDFVDRHLIASGQLEAMIKQDGLRGMTSNPSIFEKAITSSDAYQAELDEFVAAQDRSPMAIYEHLAIADIKAAADTLMPVYDATAGRDGYVSLEVSPYLAMDTSETITEARRLWRAVERPNLMIKVPATSAGIPAIRTLIGDGLSINVTLLFSVDVYERVAAAYLAGLEDRLERGQDINKIASVASFFVSRIDGVIDTEIATKIELGGDRDALQSLLGKVAIANAKRAYQRYLAIFSGPRWKELADHGGATQRVLWASTSTKNKAYRDTMYIEALIGRDTVNTIPPATMEAFRDHGLVQADAVSQNVGEAEAVLASLADHGISLERVTDALVIDGVQQFISAFDQLLGAVAARRSRLVEMNAMELQLGDACGLAVLEAGRAWHATGAMRRLWHRDQNLWTGKDEARWLGWLDIVAREKKDIAKLIQFKADVRGAGYHDVLLLGMGGSSLGPEVLGKSFGKQGDFPRLHVLDSTDPAQIRRVEEAIDLQKTLVIVSSKSGSTLEPNILLAYFSQKMADVLGDDWVRHVVAITDPGSSLEKEAKKMGFGHVFHGIPEIGGRYSVLSKFGLAPAAAIGVDIQGFLQAAGTMVNACAGDVPVAANPGAQLGLALGVAARQFGRNKVTIFSSPDLAAFGAWLEQLIAESTGKVGRGLIPVDGEPLGSSECYGTDRIFIAVSLRGGSPAAAASQLRALERAGHPVIEIEVDSITALAQEFFRWECAIAVSGAVLGINPFDQPDVEASKIKARALTDEFEASGKLPEQKPLFEHEGIMIFADAVNAERIGRHRRLDGFFRAHLSSVSDGDYVALLAYMDRNDENAGILTRMRQRIRDRFRVATCLGFGPRFLHSTGQAYKGGPNSGIFLQITADDSVDVAVPNREFSFGVVKMAQALGDFDVLTERKRRAVRVHLRDARTGLAALDEAIRGVTL